MRGAHLSLLRKVRERLGGFDVLLATDMLSLAELAGCVPALAAVPKAVYFHESQLAYPVPKGEAPDVHFGFTNLSTALAADALVFNSRFHLEEFLGGIERFLKPMPDHRPAGLAAELRPKCSVSTRASTATSSSGTARRGPRPARPPAVLWNHRWEFDKRPEVFFPALFELAERGAPLPGRTSSARTSRRSRRRSSRRASARRADRDLRAPAVAGGLHRGALGQRRRRLDRDPGVLRHRRDGGGVLRGAPAPSPAARLPGALPGGVPLRRRRGAEGAAARAARPARGTRRAGTTRPGCGSATTRGAARAARRPARRGLAAPRRG